MVNNKLWLEKFLDFLEVEETEDRLDFLNRLIYSHQRKVKWENISKILDHEAGQESGNFLPPLDRYIERIIDKGLGGTCWTLSIGFYELLKYLGYNVHYLYMDSGHLCLRVDLDQPYYVDVGYSAPLFQAYPLFQSFTVRNVRETFRYQVDGEEIRIEREPGPTKILHPRPVTLEEVLPHIRRSNDWEQSRALQEILVFAYVDGIPTSLRNNVLKQYFDHGTVERTLTERELTDWIKNKFQIDESLFLKAVEIYSARTHKSIFQ